MGGNGRWAERQGLARTEGHSQGEERLAEIVRAADALGIPWLTAYGFSTEKWRRPRLHGGFLLRLPHRELAPPAPRGRLHPRSAQEDLRSPPRDARQQREDPLDRSRHARG